MYKSDWGWGGNTLRDSGRALLTQKQVDANTPAPHPLKQWPLSALHATPPPAQEQLPHGPPNTSPNPWLDILRIFSANEESQDFGPFLLQVSTLSLGPKRYNRKWDSLFLHKKRKTKKKFKRAAFSTQWAKTRIISLWHKIKYFPGFYSFLFNPLQVQI